MKLNPSIKNMSNEYIFFTDQTALTFRICLVIIFFLIFMLRLLPYSTDIDWGVIFIEGHPIVTFL